MRDCGLYLSFDMVSTIASLSGEPTRLLHVPHPVVRCDPKRIVSWGTIDVILVDRTGTSCNRDLLGEPPNQRRIETA